MHTDKGILRRLERMENRPQSQIPKLRVEFEDGSTEAVCGYAVLTRENVRRVFYDGQHLQSVIVAGLFSALNPDVALEVM